MPVRPLRKGGAPGRRRRLRRERGSALVLMPAGVLVVLILASIAVDMSVVHLRKRQALDLAASAANDAATGGVDPADLRAGAFRLDPATARQVVLRTVAASELAPYLAAEPAVTVTAAGVEVTLAVEADYVFAGVVPGAPDGSVVTATATASAASGPSP
jgi:Flp pilus assembly protein TadG